MLPFSQPSCYFKTRPPSCALGTSFYTVSEGHDLMTYVSDNYTSYSAPSPLRLTQCQFTGTPLYRLIVRSFAGDLLSDILFSLLSLRLAQCLLVPLSTIVDLCFLLVPLSTTARSSFFAGDLLCVCVCMHIIVCDSYLYSY